MEKDKQGKVPTGVFIGIIVILIAAVALCFGFLKGLWLFISDGGWGIFATIGIIALIGVVIGIAKGDF